MRKATIVKELAYWSKEVRAAARKARKSPECEPQLAFAEAQLLLWAEEANAAGIPLTE